MHCISDRNSKYNSTSDYTAKISFRRKNTDIFNGLWRLLGKKNLEKICFCMETVILYKLKLMLTITNSCIEI